MGVCEDLAPEASGLMSIVDLDHSELLHQLVVDLQLVLLELGNHLLSQIDGQDRYQSFKIF